VIHPVGGISGGLGQLGQWREIATRMGGEIRYESRVRALLGNDRRIEGVVVSDPNEEYEMRSGSIILCAGGFQANPEMRARYLGPNADLMKVRGSRHDTGEVLMMSLALGAKAAGHWQGAHATPIDSTYPDVEIGSKANRRLSLRYYCQFARPALFRRRRGAPFVHVREDGLGVLSQPGAVAYQIYDQKTIPLLGTRYEFSTPIEANTTMSWRRRSASSPRC
jgi:tricarballylate dehydrogenase